MDDHYFKLAFVVQLHKITWLISPDFFSKINFAEKSIKQKLGVRHEEKPRDMSHDPQ